MVENYIQMKEPTRRRTGDDVDSAASPCRGWKNNWNPTLFDHVKKGHEDLPRRKSSARCRRMIPRRDLQKGG
jgi:hypothetical protein